MEGGAIGGLAAPLIPVAERGYFAGEEIMSCEAFLKCLHPSLLEIRCYNCFIVLNHPFYTYCHCPSCKLVRFCSSECASSHHRFHWYEINLYHDKPDFRTYLFNPDQNLDHFRLFLFRLYALTKSMPELADMGFSSQFGTFSFNDLLRRPEVVLINEDTKEACKPMAKYLNAHGLADGKEYEDLLPLAGVIRTKRYPIFDGIQNQIGWGITVIPSTLDHSCIPSAFCYTRGNALVVRAVGRIRPSERPSVAYIGTNCSISKRSLLLKLSFNTRCSCRICANGSDALNEALHELQRLISDINKAWNKLEHPPFDWQQTYSRHGAIMKIFMHIYEKYDANVSGQYVKMVFLGMRLGADKGVLEYLFRHAFEHVAMVFGEEHWLYSQIVEAKTWCHKGGVEYHRYWKAMINSHHKILRA